MTATCEPNDPNRDLWWAHTGCGGGNLGIVTRYFLRSASAQGDDPRRALPKAPEEVTTFKTTWDWQRLSEGSFAELITSYGEWCERNAAPEAASARLFSVLTTGRPATGPITLRGVITLGDDADALLRDHLRALEGACPAAQACETKRMSWLEFALNPLPDLFATGPGGVAAGHVQLKIKDALLRRTYDDRQLAIAYDYLTRRQPDLAGGSLGLASYGGTINAVPPSATASAQRSSVMTTSCGVVWAEPAQEAQALHWVRGFYRDIFAETGGVPAPGERCEGALINHPDADLADPAWNQSGIPWSTLYYGPNYERLQRVKARWDPCNVFRHALSIRADAS